MLESAGAIALAVDAARREAVRTTGIAGISRTVAEVARREALILCRGRALLAFASLLAVAAWLPPVLLSLRKGSLGLSPFGDTIALALAFAEIAIPLVGLLYGADMMAGEGEEGTLVAIAALPIPRPAIFAGKFIGRSALLVAAYIAAFGSSAAAIATSNGSAGLADYAAVAASGLALSVASCAIGAMLGAPARGRTRGFGAALVGWVVMVFALDAFVLAAVVTIAPAPPEEVASHGYGEMAAQAEMMKLHEMDSDEGSAAARGPSRSGANIAQWLMALDPVDLSRISAISASGTLRRRAMAAFGEPAGSGWLAACWLAWIALPLGIGTRRFSRADLK